MTEKTSIPQTLIAVDAAARGPYAAFGAVIICPDGVRLEVNGPLPRSTLQEVTAALAALRYLPAGSSAVTLYMDAQSDELRAVLAMLHPNVQVIQILRNSIPEHRRAHELARAARVSIESLTARSAVTATDPQVAVYALQSVDHGDPRYAVAFWYAGELHEYSGRVRTQPTRAQTRQALEEAVARHVHLEDYVLIQDSKAYLKSLRTDVEVNAAQLKVLRKKAQSLMFVPLTGREEGATIGTPNGDDPVSTGLAEG